LQISISPKTKPEKKHFEFSNEEGLASGRAVAAEILANKLLLRNGPTHFGRCPR